MKQLIKKIKYCISNKMMKIGVMLLTFEIAIQNKVAAATPADLEMDTSNSAALSQQIPEEVVIRKLIMRGIMLVLAIIFVISLIGLLTTSVKIKKDSKNEKINKWKKFFKTLLIISTVLLGLFLLFILFIYYFYYFYF